MFNKFKFSLFAIVLAIGIILGTQIGKIFPDDNLRNNIIKFNDVLTLIEKYYVEEVDTQKLVEAAIKEMLSKLDPHSIYITAKQLESVEESFKGEFEGIVLKSIPKYP